MIGATVGWRRRSNGAGDTRCRPRIGHAHAVQRLGRYEDALAAAGRAGAHPEALCRLHTCGLAELDRRRRPHPQRRSAPTDALERLSEITRAGRHRQGASGIEARSRALLSEGDAAERLSPRRRSPGSAAPASAPSSAAPISCYGGWLRREQPAPRPARPAAHRPRDVHRDGSRGLRRAGSRATCSATGERARRPTVETREDLTAQEPQIARLAGEGSLRPGDRRATAHQPQGRRLAPRKHFSKLGSTSHNQLDRALPNGTDVALRV